MCKIDIKKLEKYKRKFEQMKRHAIVLATLNIVKM